MSPRFSISLTRSTPDGGIDGRQERDRAVVLLSRDDRAKRGLQHGRGARALRQAAPSGSRRGAAPRPSAASCAPRPRRSLRGFRTRAGRAPRGAPALALNASRRPAVCRAPRPRPRHRTGRRACRCPRSARCRAGPAAAARRGSGSAARRRPPPRARRPRTRAPRSRDPRAPPAPAPPPRPRRSRPRRRSGSPPARRRRRGRPCRRRAPSARGGVYRRARGAGGRAAASLGEVRSHTPRSVAA